MWDQSINCVPNIVVGQHFLPTFLVEVNQYFYYTSISTPIRLNTYQNQTNHNQNIFFNFFFKT
jgi:hypothetical protein